MTDKQHTPTPWEMYETEAGIGLSKDAHPDIFSAPLWKDGDGYRRDRAKANAAFIVRACNTHQQLIDALEVIAGGYIEGANNAAIRRDWEKIVCDMQAIAKKALKAAKGEVCAAP